MARKRGDGFRLNQDKRNGIYLCRFWHEGEDFTLSTRTRDRKEAQVVAAQLYAEAISGRRRVDAPMRGDLAPVFSEWLAAIEGTTSAGDFEQCLGAVQRQLLRHFPRIEHLTPASCEDLYRARLRAVARETVRKERGVLSRFVKWATTPGRNYIPPMEVPPLSKKARGAPKLKGRSYTEVSRAETLAILDTLPERSERREHPVKAFCTLAAELGLRRELIDKLTVPEHYTVGGSELRITAEIDKEANPRTLELTPRARWALESVAPEQGVIFSGFSYFKTFRKAAASIIGEERAAYLTLRDLRHATITELAEHTGNLAAVAAGAGHKDLRTTSRYFHASAKAASEALRARTAADAKLEIVTRIAELKAQTVTVTVTGCRDGEGELGIPRVLQHGRVAQLDRALPSGAVEKSRIPCKNQGILISVGSQENEQKRAETHDNWNCASYENLDWARRAWGALRVI
jgi:integrase